MQTRHSIRRNYPVIGHFRFMIEAIRPDLRQYLFEDDTVATPFSRSQRSIVYQRAKLELDKRPFGTQLDVDCVSPARHPAFSTPIELMRFVDRLRTLSGGKPTGFKLCIGHP